tara:strand:- start:215 stop:523 length:309 start_codon:yes stop_codon:yes gene_type:complete
MRNKNWIEFDNYQNLHQIKREISNSNNSSRINVYKQKKGKKGKSITIIDGLDLNNNLFSKKLLKDLKIYCGTGGKIDDQSLHLQGNMVDKVKEFLRKDGYPL